MKQFNLRKLFFAYLLFFFAFVAFINFFHTDSILDKKPDCPACQFQQSNLALAFILFLFLIVFTCLNLPVIASSILVFLVLLSRRRTRAPPAAFS